MFRHFALTLGASVALCSAVAYVAGARTTANAALAATASTSHSTTQLAVHTLYRSGYIVASS